MLRSSAPILFLVFLLAGCTVSSRLQSTYGNKYRYSAAMVAPAKSEELLFRDDRIIIQFRLTDPALRFQLQNISPSDLYIDWEHASLGIQGTYSRVRTLATLYDTTGPLVSRQKIPSLGVLREALVPRANISFDGRQWQRVELLPSIDANSYVVKNTIEKLVGSSIDVILPVEFSGDARSYHFTFVIDTVERVSWDSYTSPVWFPAPPPVRELRPTSEDQITTAILVGGFIGFFSYMVAVKKSPVTE